MEEFLGGDGLVDEEAGAPAGCAGHFEVEPGVDGGFDAVCAVPVLRG